MRVILEYDQSWRTQPPYRRPDEPTDNGRPFEKKIRGSCHCGRIKYWLSRDKPLSSKFCHCDTCKVIHGAPCQWSAVFFKTDIAFENGAQGLHYYQTSTGRTGHDLPCKASCAHCGSLIMDEGRNMILLFPSLLNLNETQRREFAPQCHIFYLKRVVDIPDGKPKWEGLNGKSKLLDLP